ncbi:MAG TPA: DUF2442 domain-containing protein [Phycisphaerae bacterium]|nr:DUF2442 domain-containing protein [Phycisphaerae bacterium]HRR87425.1 DUF2442 domain-containing protein [Phycisphaerae bacterium]
MRSQGGYRLAITFEDGVRADLDFAPLVERGGLFADLKGIAVFAQVRVDPEAETLVWPNGADICPDVLYHIATGAPSPGEVAWTAAKCVRVKLVAAGTGA